MNYSALTHLICYIWYYSFFSLFRCYDCDSEVQQTSTKKLHETVEFIKRQKDMAPRRSASAQPSLSKTLPPVFIFSFTIQCIVLCNWLCDVLYFSRGVTFYIHSQPQYVIIFFADSNSSGPECGTITIAKGSINSFEDNSKAAKNQRNAQASVLASLPKVKVRRRV